MKVCWFSNIPSPYKMQLFSILSKEIELYCVFEARSESNRDTSWYKYDHEGFTVFYLTESNRNEIYRHIQDCDILINGDYSSKEGRKIFSYFHKRHKITCLQADGGLAVPRGLLDHVISFFMKKYDYYLSSGSETNQYFKYYGVSEEKIFTYRFTSLTRKQIEENRMMASEKDTYKGQCNYQEDFNLFSVGQMIPRKGFDTLVEAMRYLPKEIGLYIAGGNAEDNVQALIQQYNLSNVHFVGYKQEEQLRSYYAAADMFVLATRYDIWGLVINEALSYGLPVVTTDHCIAGLQMKQEGQSTSIVPIEDPKALAQAILEIYSNKKLQQSMRQDAFKISSYYALEDMAEDILSCLHQIGDHHE